MFAQQRLYLTADKDRLVPLGDDAAATLYAAPGDEIPDSAAERFGLVDGTLPASAPVRTPPKSKGRAVKGEDQTKERRGGGNKEAAGGGSKGAGGAADSAAGGTSSTPAGAAGASGTATGE